MPLHLTRSAERGRAAPGERVGLEAVLDDLDRTARHARVPCRSVGGFRWDQEDEHSTRWWPQGVAASAVDRPVLLTTSYARGAHGRNEGSRVTFVDLATLRYRHVELVEPAGPHDVRPVRVHAGGIVWHGPWLHVAATTRGLCSFHVEDLTRTPSGRYVLPMRSRYDVTDEPWRFSFVSLEPAAPTPRLVTGEYSPRRGTGRLATFDVEGSGLLRTDARGVAAATRTWRPAVSRMQGAAVVDGRWYVVTSAGPRGRGSLWSGAPDTLRERRWALPTGPEDIAYWPSAGHLWNLTEYPGRRFVYALDPARY